MEVLMLTIFVSAVLVACGVWLFVWSVRQGTHEHADRLALLPLDDAEDASPASTTNQESPPPWK